MKKNNTHLADDEIDLRDIIKSLWREKIITLSVSIICGLVGYLYTFFQPQEFKTEIIIKNPPSQLFEPYSYAYNKTKLIYNNNYNLNNNNMNLNNNNMIVEQFISDFKIKFLSLDNLQNFIEESTEFDNFKGYLKSRNISAKKYFQNKIGEVKEKNLIIPNKYFLFFTKELDGDFFLNNYAHYIKKKTVFDLKRNLKLSIMNTQNLYENALENAKLINLENPILKSMSNSNTSQVVNEPDDLFYKGSKILSQEIINLKKILIKLENDQFNFEIVADKPLTSQVNKMLGLQYFVIGLIFGLVFSIVKVFFRIQIKN